MSPAERRNTCLQRPPLPQLPAGTEESQDCPGRSQPAAAPRARLLTQAPLSSGGRQGTAALRRRTAPRPGPARAAGLRPSPAEAAPPPAPELRCGEAFRRAGRPAPEPESRERPPTAPGPRSRLLHPRAPAGPPWHRPPRSPLLPPNLPPRNRPRPGKRMTPSWASSAARWRGGKKPKKYLNYRKKE